MSSKDNQSQLHLMILCCIIYGTKLYSKIKSHVVMTVFITQFAI
jgi:hypothetical protein